MASMGATMVGGTIADLFASQDRGLPMSIFSTAAFAGNGCGGAWYGYVEQNVGWRWTNWIQLILASTTWILMNIILRETRGSVILSTIARKLRVTTGDNRYKVKADEERSSLAILIRVSLSRPLYLLATEPVVFAFSLWIAFAWGVLFLLFEAIPLVLKKVYNFDNGQTGLAFLALTIGGILGGLTNPLQEWMYKRNVQRKGPEARLYSSIIGGFLFPIGSFIFAWTQGNGPWWPPIIGIAIFTMGVYMIYLATFNYLSDCYLAYASSAMAAQS
ncbi:MFS general substrate transporter [Atractiella rhizophila]|nr:MFS general substrate transporter [Atractiella rhizophila]